jgi:ELWxxDGT repeat protein
VELWKSDGTTAGTVMVKNIDSLGSSSPSHVTAVGSTLFFSAYDGTNGVELWKSDGTTAGTVLVKDIYSGSTSSIASQTMVVLGSTVYFVADDGVKGYELWQSDGTSAGTRLTMDINVGDSSSPSEIEVVGSQIFLEADDGISGSELWGFNPSYKSFVALVAPKRLMDTRASGGRFGTTSPSGVSVRRLQVAGAAAIDGSSSGWR